jgi:molecular chaperone HtpG
MHGVIDSPDIPLNVSRSYLQEDGNVKKISAHITKKVADKLNNMFKNDRPDFEKKWDDVKVFIEYGMLTEDKFNEKANKFFLFKTIEDKYFTIEEYLEKVKETQKNKDGKTILLYAADKDLQHTYIEKATERGYDVLMIDGPLSSHIISKLEQANTNVSFARVDADTIDKLIAKDEEIPSKLTKEEEETLKPLFETVAEKGKFTVVFESMSEKDSPIVITQSEFMRRMKEQQATGGGGMTMFGNFPEMYNLSVNSNHPLVTDILNNKDEAEKTNLIKQIVDLAMLSQNMLKGKALSDFINRSLANLKN